MGIFKLKRYIWCKFNYFSSCNKAISACITECFTVRKTNWFWPLSYLKKNRVIIRGGKTFVLARLYYFIIHFTPTMCQNFNFINTYDVTNIIDRYLEKSTTNIKPTRINYEYIIFWESIAFFLHIFIPINFIYIKHERSY